MIPPIQTNYLIQAFSYLIICYYFEDHIEHGRFHLDCTINLVYD